MIKKREKRVGIKDIAEKSGVSIGTVDRVLHNRGEVKESTREKVLAVVKELGYTPNLMAKSLSSKKTLKIVIVIPNSRDNNPYWEKAIKGIKRADEELSKYKTQIIYEHFDASIPCSLREVLEKVLKENPDGIVLNPVFKSVFMEFKDVFKEREIPYVFIDVNVKDVDNLAYFGQDAEQSGRVAAKLMHMSLRDNREILIIKQSNKKVFSTHIENRISGFNSFFISNSEGYKTKIVTVEIDLQKEEEPLKTFESLIQKGTDFGGVFVPNSRGFLLAEYLAEKGVEGVVMVGYDLVEQNIKYLRSGVITYLISQKPEKQAYMAIKSLFHFILEGDRPQKTNYSPMDIIVKENIDYYV